MNRIATNMADEYGSEELKAGAIASCTDGIDCQEELNRARLLIAKGDLEGCLRILSLLGKRYLQGAVIFDLYAEALIRQGNLPDGTRYRNIFRVLEGIFKVIDEASAASNHYDADKFVPDPRSVPELIEEKSRHITHEKETIGQSDELDSFPAAVVPVTVTMGNEFMRQGHFDLALNIFDELLEKHPQDESLRGLKLLAARKNCEKHLLKILHGWLRNIEHMKSWPEKES